MSASMSSKQFWNRDGTCDYILLEARPPRKYRDSKRCQVTVESCPPGGHGACEAVQAMMVAYWRVSKRDHDGRQFWSALRAWAEVQ